jgi:DNA repair photolyase
MLIYEPKGKAREYSPLALNIYNGCDHGCTYCYVPEFKKFNKKYKHSEVSMRPNFLEILRQEAKKHYESDKPVLLSFTCDPYCKANDELQITRQTLEILLENKIPVSILTKGGLRALQDIEIFKKFKDHIQVGATLTFDNDNDSLKYEPNAALPHERIKMLKILNANNIKTWVSIEPVIFPEQSVKLIEKTLNFVDHYKIGKLNHHPEIEKDINWYEFLLYIVVLLVKNDKDFYIKKDLAKFKKDFFLSEYQTNMDYLNLKPFKKNTLLSNS